MGFAKHRRHSRSPSKGLCARCLAAAVIEFASGSGFHSHPGDEAVLAELLSGLSEPRVVRAALAEIALEGESLLDGQLSIALAALQAAGRNSGSATVTLVGVRVLHRVVLVV